MFDENRRRHDYEVYEQQAYGVLGWLEKFPDVDVRRIVARKAGRACS
ncbi:hypothetical protein MOQ72_40050 [Saccharopolyspora sp. K220]|nr:hypothetical protein [Saccharopolyspora soli]MCI2423617.1 hypothetical protein [Saccharopolyspora soli]